MGGRLPVRHYAGLEGVIKPALALLPEGKHDDQVDSTAQFLEELYRKALNSTASPATVTRLRRLRPQRR